MKTCVVNQDTNTKDYVYVSGLEHNHTDIQANYVSTRASTYYVILLVKTFLHCHVTKQSTSHDGVNFDGQLHGDNTL